MSLKKSAVVTLALGSLVLGSLFTPQVMAVPAYPELLTFTQPDGSSIEAFLKGDEHFHWIVTSDGQVLIRNAQTGYLEYAEVNITNGKKTLVASGTVVLDSTQARTSTAAVPTISKTTLSRMWKSAQTQALLVKNPGHGKMVKKQEVMQNLLSR